MGLFSRKPKIRIIGFDVIFDEGGSVYTYQKSPEEMQTILTERKMLRGDEPFSVTAVYNNGTRELVWSK